MSTFSKGTSVRYLPLLFTGVLCGCIASPDDLDREMDAFVQNYLAQSAATPKLTSDSGKNIRRLKLQDNGTGEMVLSAHLENASVSDVMDSILKQADLPYESGDVAFSGNATVLFSSLPLVQGLNLILAPSHVSVALQDGVLVFSSGVEAMAQTTTSQDASQPVRTQVVLKYIDADDAVNLLNSLQPHSEYDDDGDDSDDYDDDGSDDSDDSYGSDDSSDDDDESSDDTDSSGSGSGAVVITSSGDVEDDSDYQESEGGPQQMTASRLPGTNAVFLSGTAAQVHEAMILLRFADRERPHVIIEALVLEADAVALKRLGTRVSDAASGNYSGIDLAPGDSLNDAITFSFLSGAGNATQLTAMVDLLTDRSHARVISRPYTSTLSHETAKLEVTRDQYVIVEEGDGVRSTTPISAGITLDVTPQVLDEDIIRVQLSVEASEFISSADDTNVTIDRSNASSVMDVVSGQTIIVGGLYRHEGTQGNSGVPFLRNVPAVNLLFAQRQEQMEETEIIVYLTPHIWHLDNPPPAPLHDVKRLIARGDVE